MRQIINDIFKQINHHICSQVIAFIHTHEQLIAFLCTCYPAYWFYADLLSMTLLIAHLLTVCNVFFLHFIAVHVGAYFTFSVHVIIYIIVGCHGYCCTAHLMSRLVYFSFTIIEFGMIHIV